MKTVIDEIKETKPYLLCPAMWHSDFGLLCMINRKDCKEPKEKCKIFRNSIKL